jgi:hypothetical protein
MGAAMRATNVREKGENCRFEGWYSGMTTVCLSAFLAKAV